MMIQMKMRMEKQSDLGKRKRGVFWILIGRGNGEVEVENRVGSNKFEVVLMRMD